MSGIDAVDEKALLGEASDAAVSHGLRRYGAFVAAGRIVEPRSGKPFGRTGAPLMGGAMLGPVERIGDYHLAPTWLVREDGVHALTPRFPSSESANRYRAAVALRAGGAVGRAQDAEASAVLEAHLMRHAPAWIVPGVGNDRVAKVLQAWTMGFDLDVDALDEGEPAFGDVVACPDGFAWQRVLTRAGAASVSMACRNAVFSEFDWEMAQARDDAPTSAWYVLRDAKGRIATTVRIPPKGKGCPPEIESRDGLDPFATDKGRISMLSAYLRVPLSEAHVRNDVVAGRWDTKAVHPIR